MKSEAQRRNELEAKCSITNKANLAAMEWQPKLQVLLSGFKGKKIINADRHFTKTLSGKIRELIPSCVQYYQDYSIYTAAIFFKFHEIVGGITVYATARCPICGIKEENIADDSVPLIALRHDYTVEEILSLRTKLNEAKSEVSRLQNALFPFGEFDR